MIRFESECRPTMLMALLFAALLAGGIGKAFAAAGTFAPGTPIGAATEPKVVSSTPSNGDITVSTSTNNSNNVVTATQVTATFTQPMDAATVNILTFTVKETTGNDVLGTVMMDETKTVATFTPTSSALNPNTSYTATVMRTAKNAGGVAMANPVAWRFTTAAVVFTGQISVPLGTAGRFAILTKSGITDVFASTINGSVGSSPITGAAIHLTCAEVKTGTIYSVNAAGPLPCRVTDPTLLTKAVGDMEIAYSDAAGRILPDFIDLGAGKIGGLTLVPGLYKWNTGVLISTNVTVSGGVSDVWIFQIAGTLTQANATKVILKGGARAKNIFWQTASGVAVGTTAQFEGTILAKTKISLKTGASAHGRLLAQTAVTLQQNAVTRPAQ
ncbi:MAG: hypothetical protein JWQ87_2630 [Candidatus Sulfotelmatobacter sp.]|nr:hypothetical protein [Candidatus Sulfotelmatobacter sp.]